MYRLVGADQFADCIIIRAADRDEPRMQSPLMKQLLPVHAMLTRSGLLMARFRHRRILLCLTLLLLASLAVINFVTWFDKSHTEQSSHSTLLSRSDIIDYENFDWVSSRFALDIGEFKPENGSSIRSNYRLNWSVEPSRWPLAKPWFMANGTIKPSSRYSSHLAIWPEEVSQSSTDPSTDRIVNQLMYVPPDYKPNEYVPKGKLPLKKILLYFGKSGWGDLVLGRKKFLQDRCPVHSCFITDKAETIEQADAVVFKDRFMWPKQGRTNLAQLWILFLLECPMHTQMFTSIGSHVFNWTATYRHDSDIVAPYEKFVSYRSLWDEKTWPANLDLFESTIHQSPPVLRNYASGKTRKVAWFVSNCGARNKRLEYARELSKHIEVDIYGSCGKMKCPRSNTAKCFQLLNQQYKFYLAFENSNCRDYITEKFFVNSLGHNSDELNVVPIVMGGHPDDYRRAAPTNSYIHVDDFRSPAHLAQYLNELDADDFAYNRYFEWKSRPRKGEFVNTYFWCRLCALLHAPPDRQKALVSYENIAKWWAPKSACIDGSQQWPHLFTPS